MLGGCCGFDLISLVRSSAGDRSFDLFRCLGGVGAVFYVGFSSCFLVFSVLCSGSGGAFMFLSPSSPCLVGPGFDWGLWLSFCF